MIYRASVGQPKKYFKRSEKMVENQKRQRDHRSRAKNTCVANLHERSDERIGVHRDDVPDVYQGHLQSPNAACLSPKPFVRG